MKINYLKIYFNRIRYGYYYNNYVEKKKNKKFYKRIAYKKLPKLKNH